MQHETPPAHEAGIEEGPIVGVPPMPSAFSHDVMTEMAVELVLLVMSSASTDNIRAIDWWARARSALEGSTGRRDFGSMVSRMAGKLQIDVFQTRSAERLAALAEQMRSVDFGALRAHVRRDAGR